jgi:hypothetical protein
LTEEELLERHPRVWHMAADGMWPNIQANGLLSVSKLLDLYGVSGAAREGIEAQRRPQCVELEHPLHGRAVVRDNKPMFDASLVNCLQDGLGPKDWYRILNAKSFFWVDKARLDRLLSARAYVKDPQTVIEVDTATLLDGHRSKVRLARMNTGQTLYVPQPRGLATFHTIEAFPSGTGAIGSKQRPRIVELVVEDGVPDITNSVVRVDRFYKGLWAPIWTAGPTCAKNVAGV